MEQPAKYPLTRTAFPQILNCYKSNTTLPSVQSGYPPRFLPPPPPCAPALASTCRGAAPVAFTLIELLVVVAIIAVLAVFAFPALGRMQMSGQIAKSSSQMKQIHTAAMQYAADNNNLLPMPAEEPFIWYLKLYPYLMDGKPVPSPFFDPWATAANLKGTVFYCPLRDRSGEGEPVRSYGWNNFLKDMTQTPRVRLPLIRVRQPSKTAMLATTRNTSSLQTLQTFSYRAGSNALVVFVDGHLERLERPALENISTNTFTPFWRPEQP